MRWLGHKSLTSTHWECWAFLAPHFAVCKRVCVCILSALNSLIWASDVNLTNWNKNFLLRRNISSFAFPLLCYAVFLLWTLWFWTGELDIVPQERSEVGSVRAYCTGPPKVFNTRDVMLIIAIGGHFVKMLILLPSCPCQGQYSVESWCLYKSINT